MSEAALQERRRKQGWAAPGGSHDWIVGALKIALPATIGVLIAFLALAPLKKGQEISFVLDRNKVELTKERFRVDQARYRGQDTQGRPFLLSAQSASQVSGGSQIVNISTVEAQIRLDTGLATVNAPRARYNLEGQMVAMAGPVQIQDAQGYRLLSGDSVLNLRTQIVTSNQAATLLAPDGRRVQTQSATIDLNTRRVTSQQPVLFTAPDGYTLRTSNAVVDIDERRMVNNRPISGTMPVGSFSAGRMQVDLRDRRVVLEGRARLRIDQGVAKLR